MLKHCQRCDKDLPVGVFPSPPGRRPSSPCTPCRLRTQQAKRNAKIAAFLYRHPRCMICSKPLTSRKGMTCSRRCAFTRYNWFRDKRRSPR